MQERRQLQAVLRGQKIIYSDRINPADIGHHRMSPYILCRSDPDNISCRKEDFRMNEDRNVQTKPGGDKMNENRIEMNGVTYEVHRVHRGHDTAGGIIRQRLMEAKSQVSPLTKNSSRDYNITRGAGMSKEAR